MEGGLGGLSSSGTPASESSLRSAPAPPADPPGAGFVEGSEGPFEIPGRPAAPPNAPVPAVGPAPTGGVIGVGASCAPVVARPLGGSRPGPQPWLQTDAPAHRANHHAARFIVLSLSRSCRRRYPSPERPRPSLGPFLPASAPRAAAEPRSVRPDLPLPQRRSRRRQESVADSTPSQAFLRRRNRRRIASDWSA